MALMMQGKKEIKRNILESFRSVFPEDDLRLPRYRLLRRCLPDVDTNGRLLFEKAVRDLVSQGLVEVRNEPFTSLVLTEKGIDLLS
jgi:hypothetical protein